MTVERFENTGPLPNLAQEVFARLVAGRRYETDMSAASFRSALEAARERGLVVVPAGCEADLSDDRENFDIQGPFIVGKQVEWTTASAGPSRPFDADSARHVMEEVESLVDAELDERLDALMGASPSIDSGVFLCTTGPLSTATLVFGVAGTRQEADQMGGEYIWGHDMEKLPHQQGVIGEVVASVEMDEVESVDFSDEAAAARRDASVPYDDEPVYYLLAQYD